jgi:hypothetical protein
LEGARRSRRVPVVKWQYRAWRVAIVLATIVSALLAVGADDNW